MKKFLLGLLLSLLYLPQAIVAQSTVSGTVYDGSTNTPLPGVSVILKGTSTGTITDVEGNFSISVNPDDALLFSFVGYVSEEVNVDNQSTFEIFLTEDLTSLDEVVVVGYSSQRRKDLTGAVAVVALDEIQDQPAGNIMNNLQGRVPGVQITGNGRPGDGGTSVRIRGAGSPFSSSDPLYVIDGVPSERGMHELNPNDIESVQVLKDAAAASIYGSRAANGVVIVTTKKGKSGTKVEFRSNTSLQQFTTPLQPMNTEQRARAYWQARVNDGRPGDNPDINTNIYNFDWNGDYGNPVLNNVNFPEFIDNQNTMRSSNTNWYDEVTQTSIMQDYNVTVSDGSESGNFLFSLGYFDHDGVVKGSNFQRISGRINSEYNLFNGRVRVGENVSITNQSANQVNDEAQNIMFLSLIQHSILPVRTVDNQNFGGPVPGMTDRDNPVRLIEDKVQNVSQFNRILGNVFVEADILDNLTLRSSLGVDYNIFNYRILDKEFQVGSISGLDNLTSINDRSGATTWTNTATYSLTTGKNQLQFLLGTETIRGRFENFSASRRGYAVQDYNYAYLDNGTGVQQTSGMGSEYALQSFFGKVDYVFNDKYLAAVTVRRDGSSRFGQNNRFANFPAASVGWRISEEAFLSNFEALNDLKLRASWGQNGNQSIPDLAIFDIYRSVYSTPTLFTNEQDGGTAYDISGSGSGNLPSGFARNQTGNPDLRWETTTQINAGFDFSLFDNKVFGSADAYQKRTSDLLILQQAVGAQGEGANRIINAPGISEDRGMEFLLGYQNNIGELELRVNGNISFNRNRARDMPQEVLANFAGDGAENTVEGRNFFSFFGFVADGLFQSEAEVEAHADQSGAAPGRIRYQDLNGDGVIDQRDQRFIGSPEPDFAYGLNVDAFFRNFSLNVFFQGIAGGYLINDQRIYTDFSSQWVGANWGTRLLDAWTPQNPDSDIPAATLTDNNNEGRLSTYLMEPQSFVRLANLQLGYSIPSTITETLRMANARVFVQGQNLFLINSSESTIPDPETPNGQFPIPKTYTVGINVTF